MGRRKGPAPQQGLGRVEDRWAADAATEAAADLEQQQHEPWLAGSSPEGSEDEAARRPTKRRKRLQRGRQAGAGDERHAAVVDVASEAQQPWRFAELPLAWQAAAGPSRAAASDPPLEEGQLMLSREPGSCSVGVRSESGGAWLASIAAPSEAAAEALVSLLKSGHLSAGLGGSPASGGGGGSDGGGSSLRLSLTDKAAAEGAQHPEEQQQRLWHRHLLALLRWLLPRLDPELDGAPLQAKEQQQQQQQAGSSQPASPLASPLQSPRKAGAAATPLSPGSAPAFDASELYAAVKPTGLEPELPAGATHATLLPTLRRYQARAAQWMVSRESPAAAGIKPEPGSQQAAPPPLHPLWREVPCSGGGGSRGLSGHRCFFVNVYGGQISLERFPAEPEVRCTAWQHSVAACLWLQYRGRCVAAAAAAAVAVAVPGPACRRLTFTLPGPAAGVPCVPGPGRHPFRRDGPREDCGASGLHHLTPLHWPAPGVCQPRRRPQVRRRGGPRASDSRGGCPPACQCTSHTVPPELPSARPSAAVFPQAQEARCGGGVRVRGHRGRRLRG